MTVRSFTGIFCLIVWSVLTAEHAMGQETLKDPFTRDDDLSGTAVKFDVNLTAENHYEYIYDLSAPDSNTGQVHSFIVDLSCDEEPASKGFSASDFDFHTADDVTENDKHVPVAVRAPYGQAAAAALTVKNRISWFVSMSPGDNSQGLGLVSPYPPGDRSYQLRASSSYREDEYDYSIMREIMLDEEGDYPPLPTVDDWSVNGTTIGPACPGEEDPDFEVEPTTFAGTIFSGEPEANNQVLTYSSPLKDQLRLPETRRNVVIRVHYADNMDPRSFKVTPKKGGLKGLFSPEPGTQEQVEIPLKPGKNRIQFQASTEFVPPGKADEPAQDVVGRRGVPVDRDVFVFRVGDQSDKTKKKNGKAKGKK